MGRHASWFPCLCGVLSIVQARSGLVEYLQKELSPENGHFYLETTKKLPSQADDNLDHIMESFTEYRTLLDQIYPLDTLNSSSVLSDENGVLLSVLLRQAISSSGLDPEGKQEERSRLNSSLCCTGPPPNKKCVFASKSLEKSACDETYDESGHIASWLLDASDAVEELLLDFDKPQEISAGLQQRFQNVAPHGRAQIRSTSFELNGKTTHFFRFPIVRHQFYEFQPVLQAHLRKAHAFPCSVVLASSLVSEDHVFLRAVEFETVQPDQPEKDEPELGHGQRFGACASENCHLASFTSQNETPGPKVFGLVEMKLVKIPGLKEGGLQLKQQQDWVDALVGTNNSDSRGLQKLLSENAGFEPSMEVALQDAQSSAIPEETLAPLRASVYERKRQQEEKIRLEYKAAGGLKQDVLVERELIRMCDEKKLKELLDLLSKAGQLPRVDAGVLNRAKECGRKLRIQELLEKATNGSIQEGEVQELAQLGASRQELRFAEQQFAFATLKQLKNDHCTDPEIYRYAINLAEQKGLPASQYQEQKRELERLDLEQAKKDCHMVTLENFRTSTFREIQMSSKIASAECTLQSAIAFVNQSDGTTQDAIDTLDASIRAAQVLTVSKVLLQRANDLLASLKVELGFEEGCKRQHEELQNSLEDAKCCHWLLPHLQDVISAVNSSQCPMHINSALADAMAFVEILALKSIMESGELNKLKQGIDQLKSHNSATFSEHVERGEKILEYMRDVHSFQTALSEIESDVASGFDYPSDLLNTKRQQLVVKQDELQGLILEWQPQLLCFRQWTKIATSPLGLLGLLGVLLGVLRVLWNLLMGTSALRPSKIKVLEEIVKKIRSKVADDIDVALAMAREKAEELEDEYKNMSLDELAIVSLYTIPSIPRNKSFYFAMNKALREALTVNSEEWKEAIQLLLDAMKKLPRESSALLYRGVKRPATALGKQCQKGEKFVWSDFCSTTTRVEGLKSFLGQTGPRTLWQLQLRRNFVNLKAFSLIADEHEVLLPPQMEFKVTWTMDLGNELTLVGAMPETEIDPFTTLMQNKQAPLGKLQSCMSLPQ